VQGSSEAVRSPDAETGSVDLALEIAADPEQVRTARLFAGATARHFGLDEEVVEDLKVAISEAVTNAIRSHAAAGVDAPIRVTATAGVSSIRFDVIDRGASMVLSTPAGEADYTPPMGIGESTLSMVVISALFPSVEIAQGSDGGATVSIVIDRPPQ